MNSGFGENMKVSLITSALKKVLSSPEKVELMPKRRSARLSSQFLARTSNSEQEPVKASVQGKHCEQNL